jgi:SAM-dependent methyltransferase
MSALERLGINGKKALSAEDYSPEQTQTAECFAYKWSKRDTYESESMKNQSKNWLIERYCRGDINRLRQWLESGRKIILDAGCGSGHSAILFFGDLLKNHDYLGVDISTAVNVAQCRFEEMGYPGDFLQWDLMDLPIPDTSVDLIFAEGVLHHTESVEGSLKYLAKKLKNGGRFLFYVYKKKAIVREFTDDLIRKRIQNLTDEQAWKALMPLTKLGHVLGDMKVEIEVPEDIPFLDIKKGKIDLQRFFYWHICKLFYSPDLTLEEMNHINFDWFRPLHCHRHTPQEIEDFCAGAALTIEHMDVQKAGVTVVALKE